MLNLKNKSMNQYIDKDLKTWINLTIKILSNYDCEVMKYF